MLLERAVRSVLAQTYPNIQLVVADDGSERATGATLERLSRTNESSTSLLVVRLNPAQGACQTRNQALAACDGTLVTGLDDDDYFLPDRISRLVAAFDPEVSSFVFDGYIRETQLGGGARQVPVLLKNAAHLRDLLKRNIVGNQVLTLTSRLREVGGFDERLPAWQDYDLWIRLVKAFGEGKPAGGISYVHTVDRSRATISGDVNKIRRAFDLFLEKHAEYADRELLLCLRMAQACYGLDAVSVKDLGDLLRLGEPRFVLFTLYSYLTNRWSRKGAPG